MPIAKETLRIGFTTVALPGNYITQEAVDEYGWADKVEKGPDLPSSDDTSGDGAPAGKAKAK